MSSFVFEEIDGDLFKAPSNFSIGHCVAADLKMGKGIAVKFRDTFGQVQSLKDQKAGVGNIAVIKDGNRFIYYLITKKSSYEKPTYQSLHSSLEAMRDHMVSNQVTNLAIPRIGCGLDGLVWSKVKDLLHEIFEKQDIKIVVYNFVPGK